MTKTTKTAKTTSPVKPEAKSTVKASKTHKTSKTSASVKPSLSNKWTPKREESLKKLFSKLNGKPNWSVKIANQMRIFTANAIYKKAGRLGLTSPNWVREERENSPTLSAAYRSNQNQS